MPEHNPTHSREEIWARIDDQSKAIADIKAGQSHASARIDALENAVSSGFNSLASEIHGLAERVNAPKPQANPILVLVTSLVGFVTILGLYGAFSSVVVAPVQKQADTNTSAIQRLEDYTRELSRAQGEAKAETESLRRQLDAMDEHGSRKWIDDD